MTNEILSLLHRHINEHSIESGARFVFHSETAAVFWARHALAAFDIPVLARERFIAWDVFKAENLCAAFSDKRPVNRTLRLLYARMLCEKNAGTPFLRTLVPPAFAEDSLVFARNIAVILPSLKLWRKKTRETREDALYAPEWHDFILIEEHYESFLEEHKLFEPSWEKPPFKDTHHDYYIIYPALIEDFAEYEELLCAPNVHKIDLQLTDDADAQQLLVYESAHAEVRAAMLEIRRLHEEGIAYEDIALSAGELELLEPYLKQNLKAYNIPFRIRSGKPIADYAAGCFFSLVDECVRASFSWNAVQALLTVTALPWRCPNKNRALLDFGIANNCVAGYRHRGIKRDVWEDAFYGSQKDSRLHNHYRKLKAKLTRIAHSKNFSALLYHTRDFCAHFFLDAWTGESSRILGRVFDELSSLVLLEKKYPALASSAPLEVFSMLLKERIHVSETTHSGVNIFAYGVAASIPAAAHLVINAHQDALTKVFRPLSFLRQDKRKLLSLDDNDVSKEFIKSYQQTIYPDGRRNRVRISLSRHAFSGAAIPHSYFNRPHSLEGGHQIILNAAAPNNDIYHAEKDWWARCTDFPAMLFPEQKTGFDSWSFFYRASAYNFLYEPVPKDSSTAASIRERIKLIKYKDRDAPCPDEKLRISATSLNNFFPCPVHWLYHDIFKLKPYAVQARMLDDENKGILYHEILHDLFERITQEDGAFKTARIAEYSAWTEEIAAAKAQSFKAFRGPLAAPLIASMAEALAANITRVLEFEGAHFDLWSCAALEKACREEREHVILTGTIDRVSLSPDYIPCIIDYKSGRVPKKSACVQNDSATLEDFQMPLYIRLFEYSNSTPVEYALFLQVVQNRPVYVIRPQGRSAIQRADYQTTMEMLEVFIARHAAAVLELDLSPRVAAIDAYGTAFAQKKIPRKKCSSCAYRTICRSI
ncbi:MAG: PD-(D/E)XK nuclease family protein [Spirochaetaceae bacterium]|nr:PD-(D/E)XK nuclease family protein [Spirochaetaceae bacterium]